MSSARLTGLDSAYLSAEIPGNPLHLMAILTLDPESMPGGYSFEKLLAFMEERLPLIPPLRRKLVEVPFGIDRPRWVEMEDVDLTLHVRRRAIPSPGSPRELSILAAEMSEQLLDRSRPLWEIAVVEGLSSGEIALVAKLHHAMMDGMVGVSYMAALLGDDVDVASARAPAKPTAPIDEPSPLRLLSDGLFEVARRPYRVAQASARTFYSMASSYLSPDEAEDPDEAGQADEQERVVPPSIFNLRSGPRRDIAYFKVPLAAVKRVGEAFDATVNDVVLAMVGTASRRYLQARQQLPAESLVAGIPASTHKKGGDDLANAYTLLFPTLSTDQEDPAARLEAIRDSSRGAKAAARPVAGEDLMSEWVDIPPPWFYQLMSRLYVGLHFVERMENPFFNLLISSVPGPPVPLTFAGAKITGVHPLGPIYDGMLLNITAIGREENVDIGLVACRTGVPGLWEIVEGMGEALEALERAASQRPLPEVSGAAQPMKTVSLGSSMT